MNYRHREKADDEIEREWMSMGSHKGLRPSTSAPNRRDDFFFFGAQVFPIFNERNVATSTNIRPKKPSPRGTVCSKRKMDTCQTYQIRNKLEFFGQEKKTVD
jgi:hypothetical protein